MSALEEYNTTEFIQSSRNKVTLGVRNKFVLECYSPLQIPSTSEAYSAVDHCVDVKNSQLHEDPPELSSYSHTNPSIRHYDLTSHMKEPNKRKSDPNHSQHQFDPIAPNNTYSQLHPSSEQFLNKT